MASDDLRARLAADRLRTYVELLPSAYALGEIAYNERFRSSDWPRTAYHPNRDDLLAVLEELDREQELSQLLMGQRQQMAAERFAWQERGDRAEAEVARLTAALQQIADDTCSCDLEDCPTRIAAAALRPEPCQPVPCDDCPICRPTTKE